MDSKYLTLLRTPRTVSWVCASHTVCASTVLIHRDAKRQEASTSGESKKSGMRETANTPETDPGELAAGTREQTEDAEGSHPVHLELEVVHPA